MFCIVKTPHTKKDLTVKIHSYHLSTNHWVENSRIATVPTLADSAVDAADVVTELPV